MSDRFAPGSTRQERASRKLLVLDYGLASVSRWIIKMPGLSGRLRNARQPTTKWVWPPTTPNWPDAIAPKPSVALLRSRKSRRASCSAWGIT